MVRIIHPNHPLSGQCVEVLRGWRPNNATERGWIIQHEQLGRVVVPQSWTVAVTDDEATQQADTPLAEEGILPVAVPSLLALVVQVHMIQARQAEEMEEESNDTNTRTAQAGSSHLAGANPNSTTAIDTTVGPTAMSASGSTTGVRSNPTSGGER